MILTRFVTVIHSRHERIRMNTIWVESFCYEIISPGTELIVPALAQRGAPERLFPCSLLCEVLIPYSVFRIPADGVHPNEDGARILAANWLRALRDEFPLTRGSAAGGH